MRVPVSWLGEWVRLPEDVSLDHLHAASPHTEEIDAVGTKAAMAGLWRDSLDHLRRLSVGDHAGIARAL